MKRVLSIFALGAAIATAPCLFAQTPPPAPAPAPAKPQPLSLGEISASFEALASRVRPAVVQIFSTGYARAESEDENSSPVALIGYALWRERFQSDPKVIGKTIDLDRRPYTIIGVGDRQ